MCVKGSIGNTRMTLATIYALNDHQNVFINCVLDTLLEFSDGQLILGGDFNIPLLPSADTSLGVSSVHSGIHKRITQSLHRAQLTAVW